MNWIERGMNILKSWEFPQKAWIIILTQSTLILFLFSWLLIEYQNNPFMQQYLTNIAPTLVPILSLSFGAIAAMTATTLYYRFRKLKEANDRPDTIPRSLQARRAPRKRSPQKPLTTKTKDEQQPSGIPTPTFILTDSKPSPIAEEKADSQQSPSPTTPLETAREPEANQTQ